jgi:hypothetical protein
MPRQLVVSALVALAIPGCGSEGPDGPTQTTTPRPTASATGAPVTGAIDFALEGTIAGRKDQLHIEPDGSATLRSRNTAPRTLDLPQRVVDNVRKDVGAANLPALEARYGGPPVSDGSTQTITVAGKTVESDNGGAPDALDTALADLTDVVVNADNLVRFRLGIRTTIGPDLASIDVTRDGYAYISTPNSGNNSVKLAPSLIAGLRMTLDTVPFERLGTPGFADSRPKLDEGEVWLNYRWLTLKDPPKAARPAIVLLRSLLPAVP